MKILTNILLITILVISCTQNNSYEIDIENISTEKTLKHLRIEGTKAFAIIPESFTSVKELARYQKKEKLYFQILEMPVSYDEIKPNLSKEAIEAKGAKVNFITELKVNGYEAIFMEGPSKYEGETKFGVWFGDNTFVAAFMAVCKDNDKEGKKELMDILKTIYYDKNFDADPFELANFKFDTDISGFQFNMKASTMFIFSPNGKSDAREDYEGPMITIAPLPKMTKTDAEKYSNELIKRNEILSKTKFKSKNIIETTLAGFPAYLLISETEIELKKAFMYQAIIIGENSSLLFIGTCIKNQDKNIDIFQRSANSIEFKE